jgi:uncharacterized membrane protein (UPF0127 family)
MQSSRHEPKVEFAVSFFQKLKGLMFKKDYDKVLVFVFKRPTHTSFHTFFMRFPIDIYFFLDNELVDVRLNISPWKIVRPRRPYNLVLEAKHGLISEKEALELALSLKLRKKV